MTAKGVDDQEACGHHGVGTMGTSSSSWEGTLVIQVSLLQDVTSANTWDWTWVCNAALHFLESKKKGVFPGHGVA